MTLKKILILVLKIALSLAILGYVVWRAVQGGEAAFQRQPGGFWREVWNVAAHAGSHWWLLAAAAVACSVAVMITLIRWYYLVRALGLPFTLKEALRLGFLGYLFNLAPMGIVGGDLLKAVMLARRNPGRRPEAVASVLVDRIIGLHTLFVVASVAILCTGFGHVENERLRLVCTLTIWITVVWTLGLAALWLPDPSGGRLTALVERIPYVGPMLVRLIGAMGLYRHHLPTLLASAAMSVGVHSMFTVGVFLLGCGLYEHVHPLATQFVMNPLSAVTGVLPLPMGPFEAVLDLLYAAVPLPGGKPMALGQGLVVALAYRIVTVLIAAVGIGYYLGSRAEVADVLHQSQAESREPAAAEQALAAG